ncbi:MAG: PEP-CTERM sorting domain-containing protein [Tepidisphaera sp.]
MKTVIGAIGAAMALSGSAFAFVPWSNTNGTAAFFNWSGGGSDTGLFGSPVLVGGDTFVFFPSGFRAESNNGVAGTAYDRLEVQVDAHAGFSFSDIRITEYGDYGIIGSGEVSVGGTLFVTDLTTFNVYTDNLLSNPGSPITSGIGNWSATAGVNVGAANATSLRIVLNNNLFAITDGSSVAWIEKKVFGHAVGIQIIPTPGTIAIAGLGALAMGRRRRG